MSEKIDLQVLSSEEYRKKCRSLFWIMHFEMSKPLGVSSGYSGKAYVMIDAVAKDIYDTYKKVITKSDFGERGLFERAMFHLKNGNIGTDMLFEELGDVSVHELIHQSGKGIRKKLDEKMVSYIETLMGNMIVGRRIRSKRNVIEI